MPADAGRQAAQGANWVHEIKWDGHRVSATLEAGKPVVTRSRNGHEWTKRFPRDCHGRGGAEGAFRRY